MTRRASPGVYVESATCLLFSLSEREPKKVLLPRVPARCLQEVEYKPSPPVGRRINDQLLESQLCVSLVEKAYSLAGA